MRLRFIADRPVHSGMSMLVLVIVPNTTLLWDISQQVRIGLRLAFSSIKLTSRTLGWNVASDFVLECYPILLF